MVIHPDQGYVARLRTAWLPEHFMSDKPDPYVRETESDEHEIGLFPQTQK